MGKSNGTDSMLWFGFISGLKKVTDTDGNAVHLEQKNNCAVYNGAMI